MKSSNYTIQELKSERDALKVYLYNKYSVMDKFRPLYEQMIQSLHLSLPEHSMYECMEFFMNVRS
jgi:hypothetical protein